MEQKINIAELLKDCPKGMELDCILVSNPVRYNGLDDGVYLIDICTEDGNHFYLTKEGYIYALPDSKCVIFPKGKTSWDGFHRPFEPGDIVITDNNKHAFIYSGENDQFWECYCGVYCGTRDICINSKQWSDKRQELRLATEEEKEKLFQVIRDNGYCWNSETKTLEKLVKLEFEIDDWVVFNNHPEKGSIYQIKNVHNYEYTLQHILGGSMAIPFSRVDMLKLWTIDDAKDGDVLVDKDNNIGIFQKFEGIYWYSYIYLGCDGELRGFSIGGSHKQTDVHPATKEQRDLLFQKIKEKGYEWNDKTKILERLIIPQFKVGNRIKEKQTGICGEIISVQKNRYDVKIDDKGLYVYFREQDNWELVPNKFDITTLKPFDKVLVRDHDRAYWDITFYECYDKTNKSYPYRALGGTVYKQCIPYKDNEDLAGFVKECSDYYKTWINEENEFN